MKKWVSVFLTVAILLTFAAPALAQWDDEEYALIAPMMPALDSLVRAINAEYAGAYMPRDPDFFWVTIYLMAANYGYVHPFYQESGEGGAQLPRQAIQEFATAAFLDYDDLLPIPESMNETIWYDEAYDAYAFALSDPGMLYTEIGAFEFLEGGVAYVTINLCDGEEPGIPIETYLAILEPNPYADAIADPIFWYSVSDVQRIDD